MIDHVNGFKVEMTAHEGITRLRVWFRDGAEILDIDKLSIEGLRRMAAVFEVAANFASREAEHYYARLHNRMTK